MESKSNGSASVDPHAKPEYWGEQTEEVHFEFVIQEKKQFRHDFRVSASFSILAALVGVIASLLSTTAFLADISKDTLLSFGIGVVSFIVATIIISYIVTRLNQISLPIRAFKRGLIESYEDALEKSAVNPARKQP